MKKSITSLLLFVTTMLVQHAGAYNMQITADSLPLHIGDTVSIWCDVYDVEQKPDAKMQWVSSNTDVLDIFTNGTLYPGDSAYTYPRNFFCAAAIIPKAPGNAFVTAIYKGDSTSFWLEVAQPADSLPNDSIHLPYYQLNLTVQPLLVKPGDTAQVYLSAKNFPMVNQPVTWEVSNDSVVYLWADDHLRQVDPAKSALPQDFYAEGLALALKTGVSTITAIVGNDRVSTQINVTGALPVDTLQYYFNITPNPITIEEGTIFQPGIESNYPFQETPTYWFVKDSGIIYVESMGGTIHGLTEGESWVYAAMGNYIDSAKVTVTSKPTPTDTVTVVEKTMQLGTREKLTDLFPQVTKAMHFSVNTNHVISFDLALNVYAKNTGTVEISFYAPQGEIEFTGQITVVNNDSVKVGIKKVHMESKREVVIEFTTDVNYIFDSLIKYALSIDVVENDSVVVKSAEIIEISDAWLEQDNRILHVTLSRELKANETIKISCDKGFVSNTNTDVEFEVMVGKTDSNTQTKNTKSLNVSAYPNPVGNILHLKSDQQVQSVKIYDFQGVLKIEATQTDALKGIQVNKLQKGIYYMVTTDENGNSATSKVIKN